MARDYKTTLNLPRTAFPMKANLPQREPERLARWAQQQLYRQIQEARKDAPLFVLHDGPPFANGDVHIGTALNKILKDIVVKFKTMQGYRAPFVPGWDCHGLPIEHKVKRELGAQAQQMSQAELRRACRAYAEKYIGIQRRQFQRLGVFGDWENPYLTMSPQYEAEIIGALADMVGAGYIYRGRKPVHWCASCRTALAEAEVEYGEHESPSVYVKFPLRDRANEFAVIWTTTPWTLPANLAIAVKPEFLYVRARTPQGETWIVAEALLGPVAKATGVMLEPVEKLTGVQLVGTVARHPFVDRDSPLLASPYVTLEQGTGLVHTAPGHGAEDFEIGQQHGLDVLAPVDDGGVFTAEAGQFAGQFVFEANAAIVAHLRERGMLVGHEMVRHSYPHCWRCKQPVIFRAVEQWFIALDHAGLRQRALAEIPKVQWVPAWGQNRITGTLEQRPDWCISRQRAWGVPLPFLHCRACGRAVVDRDLILKFREQVVREGVDVWFERSVRELFGEVRCPQCGSADLEKCPDIVDVWLESGVSHRAVLRTRPELKYPADVYLEGSDQHRGWFQSSLMTAMATEGRAPFRTVVTHGFLVVRAEDTGRKQKISKSAGRPANADDYVSRYGADLLRLWVASENYQGDIPVSDEIFERVGETYFKLRNTLRILLANLYDFTPGEPVVLQEIDRWLLSRLQAVIEEAGAAYEQFEFHRVYRVLNEFCTVELSSFYVDVTKDVLYTFAPQAPERRSAQFAMWETVVVLTRLLAPIMPFTTEEVWEHIPGRPVPSVHLADFPRVDETRRDVALEKRWEQVLKLRELVAVELEKMRQAGQIGKSLEAQVRIRPGDAAQAQWLESVGREMLAMVWMVSQVEFGSPTGGGWDVTVAVAAGTKCPRCWRWQTDLGSDPKYPEICGRCARMLTLCGAEVGETYHEE
ncbi:MAG: isoleucine--tRNA ligase [Verrucomicrobiae bacterium]|nr:isoleucine--tRNA ligase [Verrucomicrobiae bacterium]